MFYSGSQRGLEATGVARELSVARNFIVMAGVLLFTGGLFDIFIVIGPNGIKLPCAGTVMYALIRTIVAFARA